MGERIEAVFEFLIFLILGPILLLFTLLGSSQLKRAFRLVEIEKKRRKNEDSTCQ